LLGLISRALLGPCLSGRSRLLLVLLLRHAAPPLADSTGEQNAAGRQAEGEEGAVCIVGCTVYNSASSSKTVPCCHCAAGKQHVAALNP
jgi:hypothetical protein